ncbi:hypothetical protein GW17_00039855 [Ensete ventricosum]|nr:hypothetical protein GW17_00039855 [Ensete ventricosum]
MYTSEAGSSPPPTTMASYAMEKKKSLSRLFVYIDKRRTSEATPRWPRSQPNVQGRRENLRLGVLADADGDLR